ncbi:hypothetical protein [Paracandidimonas soli]|uniref:Uncharacterized protein n=1 Tax=Paracandidimonas soli TaxID=1917182 RepID=A0A4R3URY2_9BURK|nr:hypothetical protein [Paracandidimonas soli]TCU93158.1 hypothetical protein EV686_11240 [Paracandidimonas soli]
MRTFIKAGMLALLAALLITGLYRPKPLEEQLMHLQVEQAMPEYADTLSDEPADLQALFLAYAYDPVLLAKARLALLRYPELARPIFLTFGDSTDFQDVLRKYGEDIVLPIHYFLANEVLTLEWMRSMNEAARAALNVFRSQQEQEQNASAGNAAGGSLTAEQRGWYAIQFLAAEGYDFLGQFVMAPGGVVRWVQTERVLEGINSFFAGGLRGLETKVRREEAIAMGDIGWAAVDVAVGVSAFKLLRMGRAGAAGGQAMTFSQRSAALGSGLWRGSAIGARLVKYGAPAVLAYVAIQHPSVIHSLLADAAEKLGLPVALVQVAGWTLLLTPVLLVLRLLLGPLAWVMAGVASLLRWGVRSGRSELSG